MHTPQQRHSSPQPLDAEDAPQPDPQAHQPHSDPPQNRTPSAATSTNALFRPFTSPHLRVMTSLGDRHPGMPTSQLSSSGPLQSTSQLQSSQFSSFHSPSPTHPVLQTSIKRTGAAGAVPCHPPSLPHWGTEAGIRPVMNLRSGSVALLNQALAQGSNSNVGKSVRQSTLDVGAKPPQRALKRVRTSNAVRASIAAHTVDRGMQAAAHRGSDEPIGGELITLGGRHHTSTTSPSARDQTLPRGPAVTANSSPPRLGSVGIHHFVAYTVPGACVCCLLLCMVLGLCASVLPYTLVTHG